MAIDLGIHRHVRPSGKCYLDKEPGSMEMEHEEILNSFIVLIPMAIYSASQ